MDHFILARLEKAGLKPSPEADRVTLIRRLNFDLVGLPPTPEEIEAFLADKSENAYEKVVDRLLLSPRHGERWARHWLDVVRFAETHGFEMNQPRPNAWPFRDYVIRAFNEDKPYDQFIREQIAGDSFGEDVATGFLVGGPWDQVKSPDPVLTQNQRADEVHDIINATATAFLGLTVACARCHDHKFDPISQRDYYGMKAILDGVQHGERVQRPPDYEERMRRLAGLRAELSTVDQRLISFDPEAGLSRILFLDDSLASSNASAPGVTQLIPRSGVEMHKTGAARGELNDPGDAGRLPNLGQNDSYWTNSMDHDVFSWNPNCSGKWRVFLSWGCGPRSHAMDARYVLDFDGNPATRDDQTEIAKVDQRKFADGSGEMQGAPLWSGFYNAGIHEFRAESRLFLRSGTNGAVLTADVALFDEDDETERSGSMPHLRSPLNARLNIDRFPPVEARFLRFSISATTDAEPCLDELEIFSAGDPMRNAALASSGAKVSASGTYAGNPAHKLEHINDAQYGNEHSWISDQAGEGWVQIEFPQVERIDQVLWSRDRSPEPKYQDRLATRYRIEVSTGGHEWKKVSSNEDRLPVSLAATIKAIRTSAGRTAKEVADLKTLLNKKQNLELEIHELDAMPKVYAGEFKEPEPTRRFHRGDATEPREMVAPAMLGAVAMPTVSSGISSNSTERERRLALAEWIVSTNNPLTARVMVNRLWQYHFGEGLVTTPSDFGANGALPSHPELLDWLAVELMNPTSGSTKPWSLKHLHRLVVTSATYRQASSARPDGRDVDAGTRLLWRFPPRRLEAEAIRDSMLFTAGKLDLRMGGPGWSPFEPNDNYVRVYAPKTEFGSNDFRRMIYAIAVRQRPDGVFGAFDCPDGGQIAPRRSRSTTPLQALNLLNSGFVMQVSDFLAERLAREAGESAEAQAQRAFLLVFGRAPSESESQNSANFIREQGRELFCRALFNANEFVYIF